MDWGTIEHSKSNNHTTTSRAAWVPAGKRHHVTVGQPTLSLAFFFPLFVRAGMFVGIHIAQTHRIASHGTTRPLASVFFFSFVGVWSMAGHEWHRTPHPQQQQHLVFPPPPLSESRSGRRHVWHRSWRIPGRHEWGKGRKTHRRRRGPSLGEEGMEGSGMAWHGVSRTGGLEAGDEKPQQQRKARKQQQHNTPVCINSSFFSLSLY